MKVIQKNMKRLFFPTYSDEFIDHWGRVYEYGCITTITFEYFLENPRMWSKVFRIPTEGE